MKQRNFIILTLGLLVSCSTLSNSEQMLTEDNWAIEKVKILGSGEVLPDFLNEGLLLSFSPN